MVSSLSNNKNTPNILDAFENPMFCNLFESTTPIPARQSTDLSFIGSEIKVECFVLVVVVDVFVFVDVVVVGVVVDVNDGNDCCVVGGVGGGVGNNSWFVNDCDGVWVSWMVDDVFFETNFIVKWIKQDNKKLIMMINNAKMYNHKSIVMIIFSLSIYEIGE